MTKFAYILYQNYGLLKKKYHKKQYFKQKRLYYTNLIGATQSLFFIQMFFNRLLKCYTAKY